MQMLRTLPLFGLIPVFIVWFGIGQLPKILLDRAEPGLRVGRLARVGVGVGLGQGHRAAGRRHAQGRPDDVRTPVQITPAVVSAEQSVSNAFTTSGLIPGHVDFKNFSYSGFNDTVGGS